jgi:hypothetical protein
MTNLVISRFYVIACTVADWYLTPPNSASRSAKLLHPCVPPTFGQRGTLLTHPTNPFKTHKDSYPLPSGSSAPSSVQRRPGPSVLL